MRVLFVCSANNESGISPVVKNQANSLEQSGVDISYFTVKEKGIVGYINAAIELRKHLKKHKYDIVHAHYSLSGFVASISRAKPLLVSLMGSDLMARRWSRFIIYIFYKFFWKLCIVKTEDMKKILGIKKIIVIPNGVDLYKFKPILKDKAQEELGWNKTNYHILFAANPDRYEKNYKLTESAYKKIREENIELHFLKNIDNNNMSLYYNASDIVVLSSLWEGSPNVIKEAMACNRPIVSTNVGDVMWLFGEEKGHFIAKFDETDLMNNLKEAILFSRTYSRTNGRERILSLGVDTESISNSIISVYKSVLNENTCK